MAEHADMRPLYFVVEHADMRPDYAQDTVLIQFSLVSFLAALATSPLTWCGEMPAHESCIARLQKTCFGDASSCVAATRIAISLLAVAVIV